MKNQLRFGFLLLFFVITIPLSAQESGEESDWFFNGYVNAGYYGNTLGSTWNGNTYYNSRNGGGLSGLYFSTGKNFDTQKHEIDWGYNFDFLFGEDYRVLKPLYGLGSDWTTGHYGNGMPDYGFLLPQLYGELAINDWSVRAGNFYTYLGYESCRANERFFYSPGIAFDSLPSVHTGTMISWNGSDKLSVSLGWVAGCDQMFDNTQHGNMVLGNFDLNLNKKCSINYAFLAGTFSNFDVDDQFHIQQTGSIHSWNFEFHPEEKWELITSAQFFHYRDENGQLQENLTFGQYIFRTVNEHWKWGVRSEWFGILPNEAEPSNDLVNFTAGFHYSPWGNDKLTVRPEIRYDYNRSSVYGKTFDRKEQISMGLDLISVF